MSDTVSITTRGGITHKTGTGFTVKFSEKWYEWEKLVNSRFETSVQESVDPHRAHVATGSNNHHRSQAFSIVRSLALNIEPVDLGLGTEEERTFVGKVARPKLTVEDQLMFAEQLVGIGHGGEGSRIAMSICAHVISNPKSSQTQREVAVETMTEAHRGFKADSAYDFSRWVEDTLEHAFSSQPFGGMRRVERMLLGKRNEETTNLGELLKATLDQLGKNYRLSTSASSKPAMWPSAKLSV